MFISVTIVRFIATSAARFWGRAIVATTAMIALTTAMVADSLKEDRCLACVGEEFSFGHNRENGAINVNHLDINLDISLGNFSGTAISYRLEQDFRSGRYRRSLRFACT
jgi:hypothetical protein